MTAARTDTVDVVVLGLGPGGEYAANKLASAGLDVVGVDELLVGGECPFFGCTPSKLMIRGADVVAEARRVEGLGGQAQVRPDWRTVAERVAKATNDWHDHGHVERLEKAGVRIVRGSGRLDGPGRVLVEGDAGTVELIARKGVVLGTGTRPSVPPIDGLAGTPFWTNREVVRLTELPDSLVVIGGGPIGCELTQAFARFGVDVTLLEMADRVMAPEEPETSDLIEQVLVGDGVDVHTGVQIERVQHDGSFTVHLSDGRNFESDALLVSAGRHPNLDRVGLETVGLDPDASTIDTDERMRAAERLWAVGDVTGKGAFTHVSRYQAVAVVRDILDRDGPWAEYHSVSRVTFTDPEVGSVGLTEQQAREAGLNVVTGLAQVDKSSRGWIHGDDTVGLIKVVADADRGILVGASAVAPYGGEVLGLLAAAVHARTPIATLRGMHFAYLTFHRTIQSALNDLGL
ncbi:MAG: NAD(P)/FAD-dependent oxidoreductase [Nocardioides sp.]